jgi:arylsulfatase A-like enzyme
MSVNRRPNIVLITADQWRGDCLGCAGGPHPVMTPHLNQLASEGARFTQAYADCPICIPQRVSTLTGWTASHFQRPYNTLERMPVDPLTSLPGRLTRQAGYQTKAVGKMHFNPERARFGFEHISLHPNDYVNWLEATPYAGMYRGHGLGGNEVYPAVSAVPEMYTHTHWIVDQAIRFLGERDPDNPFFLWMIFEAPHSPFDPPEPYERMYDRFSIPEPALGDWIDAGMPPALQAQRWARKFDQITPQVLQEIRRRYYGQISHIDYQLGRFLGELKTRGEYDDSLIIFTADHGEHLGDHGLYGKATFLQGSARVPLIVRLPASTALPLAHPALEVAEPVMTVDLFPTLLQAAGLEAPGDIDGYSLLPALQLGRGDSERVICGEAGRADGTAFALGENFKYIYYAAGGIEHLFDVRSDPQDLHNLAGQAAFAAVQQKLRHELIEYLAKFNRPLVQDGELVRTSPELDEYALRGRNDCAWRGPLHYGQGYGTVI